MSPHTRELEDLLPAYAMGALAEAELRELTPHLESGCPACARLLRDWQEVTVELALATAAMAPPAASREQILAAVRQERRGRAPATPARRRRALAALPWAALVALSLWAVLRQVDLRTEVAALREARDQAIERAAALGRQLAEARGAVARMARALEVVSSPAAESVRLVGLGPTPQASGRTFVDRGASRALFAAHNLPRLAPDKTYELWFISASGPVPAATFDVDQGGSALVDVAHLATGQSIVAWAVTIEPRPGVPKPTGAMVLKG